LHGISRIRELPSSAAEHGSPEPHLLLSGAEGGGSGVAQHRKGGNGTAIITEITNPMHVEKFIGKVDCFQVGARNMQNYELLIELEKPECRCF
jgi:hypothetical protein